MRRPRAAINVSCRPHAASSLYLEVVSHADASQFNDGYGGGHTVRNNLAFNVVRETADHG